MDLTLENNRWLEYRDEFTQLVSQNDSLLLGVQPGGRQELKLNIQEEYDLAVNVSIWGRI